MITWFFGNSGAGKTTAAEKFVENMTIVEEGQKPILLDGDSMRESISRDLDMSVIGRWEANKRVARLARRLEKQGFDIVISLICPYEALRLTVWGICKCHFIYVTGGKWGKEYPFEDPDRDEIAELSMGVLDGNEALRKEYREQSLSEN